MWPYSAILVNLEKFWTFYTICGIAELPKLDMVGELESFKKNGNFVRVRPCAVSVKIESFDIVRHLNCVRDRLLSRIVDGILMSPVEIFIPYVSLPGEPHVDVMGCSSDTSSEIHSGFSDILSDAVIPDHCAFVPAIMTWQRWETDGPRV